MEATIFNEVQNRVEAALFEVNELKAALAEVGPNAVLSLRLEFAKLELQQAIEDGRLEGGQPEVL